MSNCLGATPLATKVDGAMEEFVTDEANRLGVSKAELQRRLLDFYRESIEGESDCPECGTTIIIPLD